MAPETGPKIPLRQRVDPARVAALEQNTLHLAAVLHERSLSDVKDLANALHDLTGRTQAGDPQSRAVLSNFVQKLDLARAVAAGLVLPGNGAGGGS